jgi:ATP adenylyltransferase
MAYINQKKPKGCIFCQKPKRKEDARGYILHRSIHAYVMLNAFPYNNGHLLISPYRHVNDLEKLSDPELLDLLKTTHRAVRALTQAIAPEGFNIGINLGKVAGAGIRSHVHIHVVPRWNGDTNYMTVLAESRVIPQHLASTFKTLLPYFRGKNKREKS